MDLSDYMTVEDYKKKKGGKLSDDILVIFEDKRSGGWDCDWYGAVKDKFSSGRMYPAVPPFMPNMTDRKERDFFMNEIRSLEEPFFYEARTGKRLPDGTIVFYKIDLNLDKYCVGLWGKIKRNIKEGLGIKSVLIAYKGKLTFDNS